MCVFSVKGIAASGLPSQRVRKVWEEVPPEIVLACPQWARTLLKTGQVPVGVTALWCFLIQRFSWQQQQHLSGAHTEEPVNAPSAWGRIVLLGMLERVRFQL